MIPAAHPNKQIVQIFTAGQQQYKVHIDDTTFLYRKETDLDCHYCLFLKRGYETVEWRYDEEVESYTQHML